MTIFVIVKKNVDVVDTPVFCAGEENQQEAIAVFTNRDATNKYIQAASWDVEYESAELDNTQAVRFLATALDDGVDLAVVDPEREKQMSGEEQRIVFLRDKFAEIGALITGEFARFAG